MPKFNPLSINIIARITARTGIILFILLRIEVLMCFPRIEAASIIGRVPRPNNAMNSVPDNTLSVATAPPIATYTNPQGRKPLTIPNSKNDELAFRDMSFANEDLISELKD